MATMSVCTACTEAYCGRFPLNVSDISCNAPCKACPWGWRVHSSSSFCEQCDTPGELRDYLFIFFPILLTIYINWFVLAMEKLRYFEDSKTWVQALFSVAIVMESLLATIISLLVYPPSGQLSIDVCRVGSLADYYPMFWASSADENGQLWHCVYEAAYPRVTIVLSYFGLSIVFLVLIRLPLTFLCWRKHPHNNSLCYGLIIVPTIAALFVIFSGLLYYSFEYISLTIGAVGLAVQSMYIQWKINTLNPCKLYLSLFYWLALIISSMFVCFGVVGLTFYQYYYALLPLSVVSVFLHPLFSLCVYSHPYTRIWRLRRRPRDITPQRPGVHRWFRIDEGRGSQDNPIFPPDISTSGSTSSDAAILY